MPDLKMPTPRSWSEVSINPDSTKAVIVLDLGENQLIFYHMKPVALLTHDNICYYPDSGLTPPEVRVVHDVAGEMFLQRTQVSNFDFVLAQAFISVAMPLTKAPAEVEMRA